MNTWNQFSRLDLNEMIWLITDLDLPDVVNVGCVGVPAVVGGTRVLGVPVAVGMYVDGVVCDWAVVDSGSNSILLLILIEYSFCIHLSKYLHFCISIEYHRWVVFWA